MSNVAREKLNRMPLPGEMIDGQYVGAPIYYRVDHVSAVEATRRAAAHLRVDMGAKYARRTVAKLNAIVRRLAGEAAKLGGYVSIHIGGLSGRPEAYTIGRGEICCSVWLTVDSRIVHEIVLFVGGNLVAYDIARPGSYPQAWVRHPWKRVDVTMRRLAASVAAREAA